MSDPYNNPSAQDPNQYGQQQPQQPQDPYGQQQPQNPYGQQSQNPYSAPAGGGVDPGDGIGNVGKILSIIPCTTVIGFILNLVGYFQSKNAGFKNRHSKTGFTFNIIWVAVYIIFWIVYIAAIVPMIASQR